MKSFNFSSTRGLLRKAAIAAILATAVACFTVPSLAGPKGTIHVRPLGDRKLTIDGDISDDAFPSIDQVEPNIDDFQVTVAINSTFKPAGSPTNVLGARQSVERAGNLDLIGPDKAGPGGIYRDQLDAGPGPDIAARKYDDLRAAGALDRKSVV